MPTYPSTPVLTSFPSIGAEWSNSAYGNGALTTSGGLVLSSSAGWSAAEWVGSVETATECFITLTTLGGSGDELHLHIREDGTGANFTAYMLNISPPSTWQIVEVTAGAGAVIGSGSVAFANGDQVGITAIGSNIVAWRNGAALAAPTVDPTIASGKRGLEIFNNVWRADDFGGGVPSDVITRPPFKPIIPRLMMGQQFGKLQVFRNIPPGELQKPANPAQQPIVSKEASRRSTRW
jgi:hypothetical protein